MTQDLSEFRPSRLWKRMPAERRVTAAELFWSDEQSTEQQVEAVAALARHMKFRAKSVIALPLDKKAKYLATLPTVSDTVAARALVNYHLERQRPMMGAFLDSLGIAHEDGLINEENVTKPDAKKLQRPPRSSPRSIRRRMSSCISARSSRRIPTRGAGWLTCRG